MTLTKKRDDKINKEVQKQQITGQEHISYNSEENKQRNTYGRSAIRNDPYFLISWLFVFRSFFVQIANHIIQARDALICALFLANIVNVGGSK